MLVKPAQGFLGERANDPEVRSFKHVMKKGHPSQHKFIFFQVFILSPENALSLD